MILERLTRGERISHHETVRVHKDGREIAVSLTISPILGSAGTIIGASKIVRDITADRRSQSRIVELQAELVHVARLSTMGQMASAIAHELNQPLTAVGNYAGALGRMLSTANADPERVRDIVERIRQQTTRAGDVIRRLRDHVAKRGRDASARGHQRGGHRSSRAGIGRYTPSRRGYRHQAGCDGGKRVTRPGPDRPGDHQPGAQCRGGDGSQRTA